MSEEKKTPAEPKSIPQILNIVAEKMCDEYCRFPELCLRECGDADEATEMIIEKYCNDCPLNLITS